MSEQVDVEEDITEYFETVISFCEEMETRTVPSDESSTSKQIGTYFEEELREWFAEHEGIISEGSVAKGLDLPLFDIDVKTTSVARPQSSSPFDDPGERITGVDYNILLFVYDKSATESGNQFDIVSCVYIPKERTGDHRMSVKAQTLVEQWSKGRLSEEELRQELEDLTGLGAISDEKFDEIKESPPLDGTITISPAAQWRFSYNKMTNEQVPEGSTRLYSSEGI